MATDRTARPTAPGFSSVVPHNTVDAYIHAIMLENVCCGTMRMAIQNTIILAATDGWLYIYGRQGCHFIAICPWCGKSLVTDEEKARAFNTTGE